MMNRIMISVAGVILLSFVIGCGNSSCPAFKNEIGGLRLVQVITGTDAMLAVNRLHGEDIEVEDAAIARYQGETGKATVWVSVAATSGDAEKQVDDMVLKMRNNKRSPFSGYREIERSGILIYSFMGMGEQHYIYSRGRLVYWISAGSAVIDMICRGFM